MAAPKNNKAMDVAKPGKATPDTTARPVVITHRPIVQDPMLNQGTEAATTDSIEVKKEVVSHGSKVIKPLQETPSEVETTTKTGPEKAEEATQNSDDTKSAEEITSNESAEVDAVAEQVQGKEKQNGELSPEEKAKQEHVQKLINEKKYFVPIGQLARRRNQRATVVLVLLLVIAVGGYLAVDAGIIKTSIKLPIDLIKN